MAAQAELDNAAIKSWLCAWVANKLEIGFELIHPHLSFTSYGLNSVEIMDMLNAVEGLTGVPINSSILWELGSIDALSNYIAHCPEFLFEDAISAYGEAEGIL
jgi:acyl carrier protein